MMLKPTEVTEVNPDALASKVYPSPILSMEISLKLASPLPAETVNVPDKVPVPGLLLIIKLMESVAVTTRLPPASWTWTLMAGEMVNVADVWLGSTV